MAVFPSESLRHLKNARERGGGELFIEIRAAKDGTDRLYSCSSAEYDENGIHTKNITTMDGTVARYEYAEDDRVTRVIGQKSYTKNIYSKTGNKLDYSVSEKKSFRQYRNVRC